MLSRALGQHGRGFIKTQLLVRRPHILEKQTVLKKDLCEEGRCDTKNIKGKERSTSGEQISLFEPLGGAPELQKHELEVIQVRSTTLDFSQFRGKCELLLPCWLSLI